MKRILLILACLLWAHPSYASYTHRATATFGCTINSFAPNGTGSTCTASSNPSTTDLIRCYVFWSNGIDNTSPASISVADSNANSYTKAPASPFNGNHYQFYLKNAPANASGTIIAAFSSWGATGFGAMQCDVFTDSTPSTTVLDLESSGTGGPSTAITTPTISATSSGELLIATCSPDNQITTANSPWTIGADDGTFGIATEFQVSASSTAVNFTQNTSGNWTCVGMSFSPTAIASCSGSSPNWTANTWANLGACFTAATTANDVITVTSNLSATSALSWTAPAGGNLRGQGSLTTTGGGDVTTITDNTPSGGSPILTITVNGSGTFRMAGLTIVGGTGSDKSWMTVFNGTGTARIDHNHFNPTTYTNSSAHTNGNGNPIDFEGQVYGVGDHNILDANDAIAFYFHNGYGASVQGNENWAADTNFGTSSFFFLENNVVNCNTGGTSCRVSDCYSASRVVIRFNTLYWTSGPEMHATGHAGDDRGCRATENYKNQYLAAMGQSQPAYDVGDASSGPSIHWGAFGDAGSGTSGLKNGIIVNVTRKDNTTYTQAATPTGWGYCGTAFNGNGSNWDQNSSGALGYACIDQPGRGKGDLLTGSFPSKLNGASISWPHQAVDPVYIFANDFGIWNSGYGGAIDSNQSSGRVVADRDYYLQASGANTNSSTPFTGTTGTGWGTRAHRPATCTTGVVYWSVDQGSWNSIHAGTPIVIDSVNYYNGVLDKCTSTNTWTNAVYTPYTYPHPLDDSVSGSVTPTKSFMLLGVGR
jgi:hypothetical protein